MNIGRLARWFQIIEYAAFGRALERRRFAFFDRLSKTRHVLILGEGDGRALARLLKLAPQARFDVVESSPEMIALARQRTGNTDRVCFVNQDANGFAFSAGHYDAVLTLFFLDCFTENDARCLAKRLAALARMDLNFLDVPVLQGDHRIAGARPASHREVTGGSRTAPGRVRVRAGRLDRFRGLGPPSFILMR